MNRFIIMLTLLAMTTVLFSQESTYKKITSLANDVWKVETFNVVDKIFLLDTIEYEDNYEIPIPNETVYLDSVGIISYLFMAATNSAREKIGRLQNAEQYSRITIEDNIYANQLDSLGVNLDSMRIAKYGNRFKGTWRYRANAGAFVKFYTLEEHPTLSTRMRMVEIDGPDRINVTINELKSLTFRMDLGTGISNYTYIQQKDTDARPRFFLATKVLPSTSLVSPDNSSWIKIN